MSDNSLSNVHFMPVKVEYKVMKLKNLKPNPNNPRVDLKPGDFAYEALKKSIVKFGVVEPPVLNKRTGQIVGGHQRVKVMMDLGMEETNVAIVDIDPIEEATLNIGLNAITGEFEITKLQAVLEDISTEMPSLLMMTGFTDDEIGKMLDFDIDTENLDESFEKFDETIETQYRCPKCGYEWSGNPK